MTTTQHPLTETAAAKLWGTYPRLCYWGDWTPSGQSDLLELLRVVFDAGREHGREHAAPHHDPRPWELLNGRPVRVGDEVWQDYGDMTITAVVGRVGKDGRLWTTEGRFIGYRDLGTWCVRRTVPTPTTEKETTMPETTPAASSEPLARTLLPVPEGHGEPHHDADQIRPGDFVWQMDRNDYSHAGRAHHQDEEGDWLTEDDNLITWAARRADHPDALTIWPAPTPPAVEVELPTEHPAHLTDVEREDGDWCDHMAMTRAGDWCGVNHEGWLRVCTLYDLAAFTLPDGTRARRDGEHADGTPRFVKVEADQ